MRIFFAVFLLSFYFLSCSEKKTYNQEIALPFKNVDVAYHQLEVDASEDKVIRMANGSSISVPKNAFVDKNGNPITGKVKLEYREFHTAADIIASGIPMTYEDENGNMKQMESGGMFEIKGKVNNEEVFISKGKELSVNMASAIPGDFDFYYLEEEGKTQQIEASLAFIGNAYGQKDESEKRKARWLKLTNNVDKPESNVEEGTFPDAQCFSLKFDTVKFPETKNLQSIKWHVAKDGLTMNPLEIPNTWVTEQNWEIAEISSPRNIVKLNKQVDDLPNQGLLFLRNYLDDTSRVVIQKDGLHLYTFSGEKTAAFSDTSITYFSNTSTESKRIITAHKGGNKILWTLEGKKIKELGNVYDIHFLNRGTRLIYTSRDDQFRQAAHLIDLNGKEILAIQLTSTREGDSYYDFVRDLHTTTDKKHFLIYSNEGVRVWDSNGKLIATYVVPEDIFVAHVNFTPYDNSIYISFRDGSVKIWEWKNNKWYSPGDEYRLTENYSYISSCFHPTSPVMIINKEDNYVNLWNWKSNTIKKLPSHVNGGINEFEGPYIHSRLSSGKINSEALSSEDGALIVRKKVHEIYSKNKQSALLFAGQFLQWRDRKGNLIKDFTAYDSTVQHGTFIDNERVITLSDVGNLNIWDKNGNIVKTISIGYDVRYILSATPTYIYAVTSKGMVKVWDYQGNLIQNYGFIDWVVPVMPDEKYFILYSGSSMKFWEITSDTLPPDVYLLSLKTDKKTFSTYVTLNKEDLRRIEDYKKGKDEKLQVEAKRSQSETALVRSFQIRNFGVYNWDRFYKDENMIAVNASFDLGSNVNGYNDVTVFLIMGKDQNTVVKYYKETWDKFKYDPKVPNQLLAVLPNDQITVFDRKEFEKLNVEEVRKSGKHTFKMKVLDKVESVGALNKILKTPS